MCKKKADRDAAINNFFDKLRGESYSRPAAIYELADDGQADLIGFSVIWEGALTFLGVRSNNSVFCTESVPYPTMGLRGIAAHFGGDYATAI